MIHIRKAQETDIPRLEELFLITRRQTFHWENPDKFQLEDFKKVTTGETLFVAEDDQGEILGFISVYEQEVPPFIHHLFVAPNHQRGGIGEQLIRSLFPWLPRPYRLKCLLRNHKALEFYLKNNWIALESGDSEEGPYFLFELPKDN